MGLPDPAAMREARLVLDMVEAMDIPSTDLVVELQGRYDKARGAAARLVNAEEHEIALVESTSHGLGLVAAALPLGPGDNVLVCDLEFFPTVLCWKARQEEMDLEVRAVRTQGGRVTPADFEARMDAHTRALVISSVQEINGFRADVAALAELAHTQGALLLVDGVQEVGALAVDVRALGADVYCCGGHKWLRNPFGMGFMYVSAALQESLSPGFYGYFNAADPSGGWGTYLASLQRSPFDHLDIKPGARRFETGGYGNYVGAAALHVLLEGILAEGIESIERHVLALGAHLVRSAEELGVEVRSSQEPGRRSGITTLGLPGGLEQELALNDHLLRNDVFVSVRYTSGVGGVRVSPHQHNSTADVDRLLHETKNYLRSCDSVAHHVGLGPGIKRQSESWQHLTTNQSVV